jgi:hypothetical protein
VRPCRSILRRVLGSRPSAVAFGARNASTITYSEATPIALRSSLFEQGEATPIALRSGLFEQGVRPSSELGSSLTARTEECQFARDGEVRGEDFVRVRR